MDSFSDIIDAFQGTFGEAIGVPDSHARAMKARDSIPDGYWSRTVVAAAAKRIEGITLELLAKLAAAKLEKALRAKESAQ
jgi:hypothetical protein